MNVICNVSNQCPHSYGCNHGVIHEENEDCGNGCTECTFAKCIESGWG